MKYIINMESEMSIVSSQAIQLFRIGWTLLRLIAVLSSSIVVILSSLLPLFLYTSLSFGYLMWMLVFLSVAAITFHGALTHLFNDYTDFHSGTDAHSPAILSGGSRVIQKGMMHPQHVFKLGKWLSGSLLTIAVLTALLGRYDMAILIVVGVWAAVSYSLPPLQLSYRPFLGEWLSLFPSIFFLGLAGPWMILDAIPLWAVQNAVINALVCMAWVMVHHIPDLEADRMATPIKRTSVVWFANKFGVNYAPLPALIYFMMAGFCTIWLFPNRSLAGIILILLFSFALFLVSHINPKDHQQVTKYEKLLLLLAIVIAITLGIF